MPSMELTNNETGYLADKAGPRYEAFLNWVPIQEVEPSCISVTPVSSTTLSQLYQALLLVGLI